MNYEAKIADLGNTPNAASAGPAFEEERQTRRKRLLIAAIIAVGLIALAAWMLTRGGGEPTFALEAETAPAVTVIAPGRGTIEGIINATGTLAARREMPVGVVGEGGRVTSIPVEAGDWVKAGQVLAVLDRSVQVQQVQSQQANIEVARADSQLAQSNLDRALQLVERGFISQADVDRLTATRDAARARVRVAEAQLRELRERNARLNIVAPAGGLLLQRNVELGQVVGAGGTALFTIARGGEMEVLTQLGETDLAAVPTGAVGTVIPVGSDRTFQCQVWQKAPIINEQTRQGTARCALSYAPELRPGGFATVRLNSGALVAPMLPESAILSDDDGSYVYIVDQNNKVVRRPVQLGMVTDSGIAIASGLSGQERVVMRAGGFLAEGETVRPVTQRPAG
jgi:RND family efflux transporter MFP subunit